MKIEDYNEYYIQGSDHYLIPKDVFKELFNEMINWREEAKELKKQLGKCYCNRTDCSSRIKDSKKYDSLVQAQEYQQKEFIEYLENEIYSFELRGTSPEYNFENVLKRILLKYKEIIGVSDEK